jgi:hypothetical protein
MHDNLHPDAARAVDFLSWLNPGAPLYLEHMSSDGPVRPVAEVFSPQEREAAERYVADSNADSQRCNMYWLPNAEFLSGKRAKANLSAARFLHVDLDCKDYPGSEEEQSNRIIGLLTDPGQRIKGVPAPSTIWFTGGGYQAIWRLADPIGIELAEEMNRALLAVLQGGPGTHDPSRLLRLPWTVNWLNDKKRSAGRVPKLAFVMDPVDFSTSPASYKPNDFKLRMSNESPSSRSAQSVLVDSAALEPLPLPDDFSEILPPDPDWVDAITTGVNPPGKEYQSRSELVFAASLWMLSRDMKPGHVVSILTDPNFGISAHVLEKPDAVRYAQRQVLKAMESLATHRTEGDGRIVITLWPGFIPQIVDAAEQALMREDIGIYQRFDALVRVVRLVVGVDEEGVGRDSGALILKPVTVPWLKEQFARVARWEKPGKKGATVRANPPSDAATAYLARVGEWKLRFLQGITQSPTLRADGTVLQEPGYDPVSGLLYDPGRIAFPEVADAPSREDARAALDILYAPFRDFCFADEADRSVALAAVLTALVRAMFPSAPLFAIDAPTAGTGKSLLTETIAIIVTGHKPAMMSQGKSDEENEKRLVSVLMAGDQVIVIDNCDRPIEGDFLCSMLSQEMVQPRILGKSETRRLPTRCLVLATGNNLVLSGDVTRRALVCRLDAGVERPDQRQFRFDPREEALARRPQLVAAGLTILRAYIAAGHPNPMSKIGSFESWNVVREALVWLGCHDPADTRDRILADDPQKAVLLDLLRLWRQALREQRVTLTELASLPDRDGDVRKLIEELTANTRQPGFNARSVGRFLAKHIDRVVGGLALRAEADSSGIKRYHVIEAGQRDEAATQDGASPF